MRGDSFLCCGVGELRRGRGDSPGPRGDCSTGWAVGQGGHRSTGSRWHTALDVEVTYLTLGIWYNGAGGLYGWWCGVTGSAPLCVCETECKEM